MKKQYLVMVQHEYQRKENTWSNVRWFKDCRRYYTTKADAMKALKSYIAEHNKTFSYDRNGKRTETKAVGGGFCADLKIDKSMDDAGRVVAWKIKVRQVSEWEDVDSKTNI